MAQRDIRRNVFRQIISNQLDTDLFSGFASKLLKGGLTTFNLDDYNRILDRLSPELIDTIPDLTPRIVSSNFIDTALILSEQQVSTAELRLSDSADNIFMRVNFIGNSENKLIDSLKVGGGISSVDHVLHPDNYDSSNKKTVYYTQPLQVGSKLYTDNTLTNQFQPFYTTSYFVIEGINNDTNLEAQLVGSYKDYFEDVFQALTSYGPNTGTGVWTGDTPLAKQMRSTYGNIDFTGGILEVDRNTGEVTNLYKMTGEFEPSTTLFDRGDEIPDIELQTISTPTGTSSNTTATNPGQGSGGFNPNVGSTGGGL
jgi:hypothetical protein